MPLVVANGTRVAVSVALLRARMLLPVRTGKVAVRSAVCAPASIVRSAPADWASVSNLMVLVASPEPMMEKLLSMTVTVEVKAHA